MEEVKSSILWFAWIYIDFYPGKKSLADHTCIKLEKVGHALYILTGCLQIVMRTHKCLLWMNKNDIALLSMKNL